MKPVLVTTRTAKKAHIHTGGFISFGGPGTPVAMCGTTCSGELGKRALAKLPMCKFCQAKHDKELG